MRCSKCRDKMPDGNVETVALVANNNDSLIPYNAKRTYLYVGCTVATAYYFLPGTPTASQPGGMRVSNAMPGIELRASDCGDLVKGPHSIWNAGTATALTYVEGLEPE